jgi:hypothetical protein
MSFPVICRSDSNYAERPLALFWQGQRYEIIEIVARWRTPAGRRFLVKTEDLMLFDLYYDENEKSWQVSQS